MRSSTILTLLGASLAVATPLAHQHLHKKAVVYDIVTDVVYMTVTEGETPSVPVTTVHVPHTVFVDFVEPTSSSKKPTSTYVPPPPPPPPTTTKPPPPTTTTKAPEPTTTEAAPVKVITEAPVAAVAPTSAAPVASSAPAASSGGSFASTGVDNHNTCRGSHSAQPVSWNDTLASYAAKTAATCVFAHDM